MTSEPLPVLSLRDLEDDVAIAERLQIADVVVVVVVLGYADRAQLQRLQAEHLSAFADPCAGISPVQNRAGTSSMALRARPDQLDGSLPGVEQFLGDARLIAAARRYLGTGARANEAAYLTLDRPDGRPVTALHYDRIHALKAFLYLTDADCDSGALEVIPGSVERGRTTPGSPPTVRRGGDGPADNDRPRRPALHPRRRPSLHAYHLRHGVPPSRRPGCGSVRAGVLRIHLHTAPSAITPCGSLQ